MKDITLVYISPHNWYDHVNKNKVNRPYKLAEQFSKDRKFRDIVIVNRIRPDRLYSKQTERQLIFTGLGFKIFQCNKNERTYYLEHCYPYGLFEQSMLPRILKKASNILQVYKKIVMVADPKSATIFHNIKEISIFDAYDDWSLVPVIQENKRERAAVTKGYDAAIKKADFILINTSYLAKKFERQSGNVVIVGNTSSILNESLNSEPINFNTDKKVIGYIGNIYERIDLELVKQIVESFPNEKIVFVGRYIGSEGEVKEQFTKILNLPNVLHIDHVPYHQVPNYIKSFDVCMIPHYVNNLTLTQDSMKLYDFLSLGKPIVTTPIPPSDLLSDFIYVASGPEEFVGKVKLALEENDKKITVERIEFMKRNNWAARTNEIYSLIKDVAL